MQKYVNRTSSVVDYTAKLNEAMAALTNKANVAKLTHRECEDMNTIMLQLEGSLASEFKHDRYNAWHEHVDVSHEARSAAHAAIHAYNQLGVFDRILELSYCDPTQQRSKDEIEKAVAAEVDIATKALNEMNVWLVTEVAKGLQGKPKDEVDATIEKIYSQAMEANPEANIANVFLKYEQMWLTALTGKYGIQPIQFREAVIARAYLFAHHPNEYVTSMNRDYGKLYCALEIEQDSVLNFLYSNYMMGVFQALDGKNKPNNDSQQKERIFAKLRPFVYTLVEIGAFDPQARSTSMGGYEGYLESYFSQYIAEVKAHLKSNEAASKMATATADAKTAAVGSGGAATASTETAAAPATAAAKPETALDVKTAPPAPKGTAAAIGAFSATMTAADAKTAAAGSAAASGETATAPAKPAKATVAAAMGMGGNL